MNKDVCVAFIFFSFLFVFFVFNSIFLCRMWKWNIFSLAVVSWLDLDAVSDLAPADEAPVLLDTSTERDLFADGCAH